MNDDKFKEEVGLASGEPLKPKSRRGFASMTPERRREIARKGGASVPKDKRSFSQNNELAIRAGKKGGEAFGKSKKRDNKEEQ